MHSTTIFLLTIGLLATIAMARPGKRPGSGHHGGNGGSHGHGNGGSHGNGNKGSVFRVPNHIRLPLELAGKLERPRETFIAKKIFDGKYLVIAPALIFKLKDVNNDTDSSTTVVPETSTAVPIESTTDEVSVEETTTTPESEEEETTTAAPSFFKKRSFSINDDEQILFLED
jgi:hypothetical protein